MPEYRAPDESNMFWHSLVLYRLGSLTYTFFGMGSRLHAAITGRRFRRPPPPWRQRAPSFGVALKRPHAVELGADVRVRDAHLRRGAVQALLHVLEGLAQVKPPGMTQVYTPKSGSTSAHRLPSGGTGCTKAGSTILSSSAIRRKSSSAPLAHPVGAQFFGHVSPLAPVSLPKTSDVVKHARVAALARTCIATRTMHATVVLVVALARALHESANHTDCFPSTATVRVNGARTPLAALRRGDVVDAATVDGSLARDAVSSFSIARAGVAAHFVRLHTAGGRNVTLTPTHHLPTGGACCAHLSLAGDVAVGARLWVRADRSVVADRVVRISHVREYGLHSPVLANGLHPIVDDVVTSFARIEAVRAAAVMVPAVEWLCAASGTCDAVRELWERLRAWTTALHLTSDATEAFQSRR